MRARSSPSTRTRPSSARSRPPSRFMTVVLPDPDGPMIASHSPCLISKLTRSRAITPFSYRRVTLSISMKDTRDLPLSVPSQRRRRLDRQGAPERNVDGNQADDHRQAEHDGDDRQARLDRGAEQAAADQAGDAGAEQEPGEGAEDPQEPDLA